MRRLAKPMTDKVAGRINQKQTMVEPGAEVSTRTTSSLELESGSRSVSSIVRQWNRKTNALLGDSSSSTNGTRTIRSDTVLMLWLYFKLFKGSIRKFILVSVLYVGTCKHIDIFQAQSCLLGLWLFLISSFLVAFRMVSHPHPSASELLGIL